MLRASQLLSNEGHDGTRAAVLAGGSVTLNRLVQACKSRFALERGRFQWRSGRLE